MHGYLTSSDVLSALGVPVNYSMVSLAVGQVFDASYDLILGDFLGDIAALLDDGGVKVHMMYGDRDFVCNWMGGEAASLAVPWKRMAEFAAAGYAPLIVSSSDGGSTSASSVDGIEERRAAIKGMTRQVGNFSFTRVFQAGHEVPSYQPQAAYEIFMRATFNRDVPTGLLPVTDALRTVGLGDTRGVRQAPPELPTPRCYVMTPGTCTAEVWETVKNGTAVVKDFFVVGVEGGEDERQERGWGDL
jgi:hypothetical protein